MKTIELQEHQDEFKTMREKSGVPGQTCYTIKRVSGLDLIFWKRWEYRDDGMSPKWVRCGDFSGSQKDVDAFIECFWYDKDGPEPQDFERVAFHDNLTRRAN